jgi:blue light- and temperature-responsive anti-repressor
MPARPDSQAAADPGQAALRNAAPGYSYAYQPIVDIDARQIISYEALIRGPRGEPAGQVFARVRPEETHSFDTESRVTAIRLAARLGIACDLNLNFLPQSLFASRHSIESVLQTADEVHLPIEQIVVEVTEGEVIDDHARFAQLINTYRGIGLKVAIDDFGAGYSGLNLLAEFQPDQIKIDMALVRGIQGNGARQAIVRAIAGACLDLGIDVIAEGIETREEFRWFASEGVHLFQGYYFAKPGFEHLPPAAWP